MQNTARCVSFMTRKYVWAWSLHLGCKQLKEMLVFTKRIRALGMMRVMMRVDDACDDAC